MSKKKTKKFIATVAATAVLVAPVVATPVDAAAMSSSDFTKAVNALAAKAKANDTFYTEVKNLNNSYNNPAILSASQKSKVSAATVTNLNNAVAAVALMERIDDLSETSTAEEVASIRTAQAKLSFSAKLLVINTGRLVEIESLIKASEANKTAAAKVTTQIKALGLKPTEVAVKAAEDAFGLLTTVQKDLVHADDKTALTAARNYITLFKDASLKVDTYVNKTKGLASVQGDRTIALNEANDVYTGITEAELNSLTTAKLAELNNAKTVYKNYKAAQGIIDRIAALELTPTGDFGAYAAQVQQVRTDYLTFTFDQKLMVSNINVLVGHEKRVAQGATPADPNKEAAKPVIALIDALPNPTGLTSLSDAQITAITNASGQFEQLADVVKAEVSNKDKLTQLLNSALYKNSGAVAAFVAEMNGLKLRSAAQIEAAMVALAANYDNLGDAKSAVQAQYDTVLAAKAVVTKINQAIAGIPTVMDSTVADEKLTALLNAQTTLTEAVDENEDVQPYVRNAQALDQKIVAVKTALKGTASTAITAIPDSNATTATELKSKTETARVAVNKYGVIMGITDFGAQTATEAATAINYNNLVAAEAAVPAVEEVAKLTYIHPTSGPVNPTALTAAIAAFNIAKGKVTNLASDNDYFVNKSKYEGLDKTAIESSLTALAAAADTEIGKIKTASPKTAKGLQDAIDAAEAAVKSYVDANKAYVGENNATTDAIKNFAQIALAKLAIDAVTEIDKIVDYNVDPANAITTNQAARTSYDAITNKDVKEFVINYTLLEANELKVSSKLGTLLSTAIAAISNLEHSQNKAELTTNAGLAETAIDAYVDGYKAVNGADADADATITNLADYSEVVALLGTSNSLLDLAAGLPADLTGNLTEAVTKYLAVKALVDPKPDYKFFTADEKAAYVKLGSLLEGHLTGLKDAANDTITNIKALKTATDKSLTDLDNAIKAAVGTAVDAPGAVNTYVAFYEAMKKGTATEAQATLTDYAEITAAEEVLDDIVTRVNTAVTGAYTHADDYDVTELTALNTAIADLKDLKAEISAKTDVNYFVNKGAFEALVNEVNMSLTALNGVATDAITALTGVAEVDGKVAGPLKTKVEAARAAASTYITAYKDWNNVTDHVAQQQLATFANIALASDAQVAQEQIEALSYTHPVSPAPVVLANLENAVLQLDVAKHYVTETMEANTYYKAYGETKYKAAVQAIDNSLGALKGAAETAIDALEGVTTTTILGTNITAATNASNDFIKIYKMYNKGKTEADAKAAIADYANIAYATTAKPVAEKIEKLTYTHPADGAVNTTTLATAIADYHTALTAFNKLEDEEKEFVFNSNKLVSADATPDVVSQLKASLDQLKLDAVTAIGKLSDEDEVTDAATLNTLVAAAETAKSNYETALKAFTKLETIAESDAISNLADLTNAKAAVSVAITIEVAMGAIDKADTPKDHERLVELINAKTAYGLLDASVQSFVFNAQDLLDEIANVDPKFETRTGLLDTANSKVGLLTANKIATEVEKLISEANAAVQAYIADSNKLTNTADPLATDVANYSEIALYEAALPTINAIIAISTANDEAEAEAIATAEELYGKLDAAKQAKVVNYTDIAAAKKALADTAVQTATNAKTAAKNAIAAIKTKTTKGEFAAQIETAEGLVEAYVELSDKNTSFDIDNIDDLEYAKAALPVITAIANLVLEENVTLDEIQDVKAAYEVLDALEKAFVFNFNELNGLEFDKNSEAQTGAQDLVSGLIEVEAANLATSLTDAKAAYNKLTDEQKASAEGQLIKTNLDNYEKTLTTVEKIAALDYTNWTVTTDLTVVEPKVKEARAEFAKLTFDQKLVVVNFTDLLAAEEKLIDVKDLQAKAAEQAIVNAVIEKIDNLDDLVDTAGYATAVAEARVEFNKLIFNHKLLVLNLADLVRHEASLK